MSIDKRKVVDLYYLSTMEKDVLAVIDALREAELEALKEIESPIQDIPEGAHPSEAWKLLMRKLWGQDE